MHDAIAMGDVDVELVQRVAAKVDEVLLHLHFDVVPREVLAQQITIAAAELVGDRERKIFTHSGMGAPAALFAFRL